MAWWRRDPSLWCRSPLHRYARKTLRENEAQLRALRPRCFSKSEPRRAQHNDDDGKRPVGLSDLEWIQLQHYRRWRRKIEHDPYRTIFGASEDMLNGKGLKDWEWVYKAFPRWMAREMNMTEPVGKDFKKEQSPEGADSGDSVNSEQDPSNSSSPYPKKVRISLSTTETISPSDTRRPREQPHIDPSDAAPVNHASATIEDPVQNKETKKMRSKEEAATRETDFITEFLADKPAAPTRSPISQYGGWRQTVLDRRAASNSATQNDMPPNECPTMESNTGYVKNDSPPPNSPAGNRFWPAMFDRGHSLPDTPTPIPSSQSPAESHEDTVCGQAMASDQFLPNDSAANPETYQKRRKTMASYTLLKDDELAQETACSTPSEPSIRPTSDVLSQLPKDDLDLLSASDIRASMGIKKGSDDVDSGKGATRQQLEQEFINAQEKDMELHPMIESKVMNDQKIRRFKNNAKGAAVEQSDPHVLEKSVDRLARTERRIRRDAPLDDNSPARETSIDRLARLKESSAGTRQDKSSSTTPKTGFAQWLQDGGSSFAKAFWSGPAELADPLKSRARMLKHILSGMQQSYTMSQSIAEELTKKYPNLTRVKNSLEDLDQHAKEVGLVVSRMFKESQKTNDNPESDSKEIDEHQRAQRLRLRGEYNRLWQDLRRTWSMITTLTDRLGPALREPGHEYPARQLQRDLYSSQERHLKTVRALGRLFWHDAGIYRRKNLHSASVTASTVAPTFKDAPSQQKLEDEIQAQKTAMQGLSDDGYAREPKEVNKKSFDEPSPLAHSLFRPFNQYFAGLGKTSEGESKIDEAAAKRQQTRNDRDLIREVRKAYEDVYGPITIHHRQIKMKEEPSTAAPYQTTRDAEQTALSDITEASNDLKETDQPVASAQKITETVQAITTEASDAATVTEPVEQATEEPAIDLSAQEKRTAALLKASKKIVQPSAGKPEAQPERQPSATISGTVAEESGPKTEAFPSTSMTYQILAYHPPLDEVIKMSTSSYTPPVSATPIPLPDALQTLEHPTRFLPHLPHGFDIVACRANMIVLREHEHGSTSISDFQILKENEGKDEEWKHINPVDGMTRLSPTGFAGVDPAFGEQAGEKERGEEAERAYEAFMRDAKEKEREGRWKKKKDKKRKGGVGGVVKTAIWAAAGCYVVGVVGELGSKS